MIIKSKIYTLLAVAAFICGFSLNSSAQFEVGNTMTAEELVNDYLLGEGVTATNITFNGLPGDQVNVQLGSFDGTSSNFSLDSGVVMVTDVATFAEDGVSGTLDNPAPEDPDLAAISGQNMNDGATLEFDFQPAGDSLKFNYVFASIEYPGFVCSQFNDAFGFFLSGPGINGPYENDAVNIALIPDSDIPVAINTVNNGEAGGSYDPATCAEADPNWQDNTVYFVDNFTEPDPNTIAFDGFTVPLTAEAEVTCFETYHIKLAIADASDGALNSGVFLEAGSFVSNPLVNVDVTPTVNGIPIPDFEDVVEGCASGTFTFTRQNDEGEQGVLFELGGNAILGEDYELNTDTVFFEDGQDETTLEFTANADGLFNENDSINITVYSFSPCGDTLTSTGTIDIIDDYEFQINANDILVECPTDSVHLSAAAGEGIPPYTYSWDVNGEAQEGNPLTIPLPEEDTDYTLEVWDYCQFDTVSTSITVDNEVQPPPVVDAGEDQIAPCPEDPVTLEATSELGQDPITYEWSNGQASQSISVFIEEDEELFTVTATDMCGTESEPDTIVVSLAEYPPFMASIEDQYSICAGDEVTITPDVSGGAGDYQYDWNTGDGTSELVFNPEVDTLISLVVTDLCGYTVEDSAQVDVQQYDPLTVDGTQAETECPGDSVTVSVTPAGGAGSYQFSWVNLEETTSSVDVAPEMTTFYTVQVTDLCGNQVGGSPSVTVPVYEPVSLVFSTIPDCKGETVQINVDSLDGGAGGYEFQWQGPGQFETDENTGSTVITNPDSTQSYMLTITDQCETASEFDLKPPVPPVDPIPNVLTPNGDGRNDRLVIKGLKTGPEEGFFANSKLQVFNRWGNEVFSSENYQNDWEPDDLELGTYFYTLRVDQGDCVFNGSLELLD